MLGVSDVLDWKEALLVQASGETYQMHTLLELTARPLPSEQMSQITIA